MQNQLSQIKNPTNSKFPVPTIYSLKGPEYFQSSHDHFAMALYICTKKIIDYVCNGQ